MKTLRLRNLILGQGRPKICAPIMGRSVAELVAQAEDLTRLPVDMAEWRYDFMRGAAGWNEAGLLEGILQALRKALGNMPLLFTYRTEGEMSGMRETPMDYGILLEAAVCSGQADMVDIELCREETLISRLVAKARQRGVKALVSQHDFQGTPSLEAMVGAFMRMEQAGADIAKLAVTPHCPEDVLKLLTAAQAASQKLQIPFAAISMGKLGMLTRLGGGLFGAAFTFGAAAARSAPGQPGVEALHEAFTMLYNG